MSESESFFGDPDPIFADKELLRVSHLPEGDRIIGRDQELQKLANAIKDAQRGGTPNNVLIYGKTGTGKSLCSKYITRDLTQAAADNGIKVGVAYVDCFQESTETQTVRTIAQALNDPTQTDITVPHTGVSTSDYYRRLWDILDARLDVGLVILDEIDKLEDDNVLMQLSRAAEAGKVTESTLGVIGISNKIRYKDSLNERVKSSLSERDFVFPPYDANQLREILRSRADAFREGVLDEDVIPKVAALAAKEHGDARKAIDILRYAGEIADEHGDDTVRVEYVDEAHDREEQARLSELIAKQPEHSKYLLQALSLQAQEAPDDDSAIPTKDIYSMYELVCERNGVDPLKMRRVRDLLSELAFLSLIEQERKGRGKGKGAHTVNQLVDEPEVVVEACKSA
ncbi:Cdc6/Cdc18 family protein [Halobellus limi]|jgi:cell division control protein 6|uniref:ORC1-type DNA replication protein n=1 Tax=Halobellus limi TaxID=699433 RepID=A0A1H6BTW8_9EURY|nr:orc1/cdc6 family replication initiation protein [Halobellus limi]QCC49475.1 AAA family ATPase [Halobellus limi]SEG64148.1 cell division control protein 6 [Halobellus limi]